MKFSDYRSRVPEYGEISHFRAPYKNLYVAGFGSNLPMTGDLLQIDNRGYLVLKEENKQPIFNILNKSTAKPIQSTVPAVAIFISGTGALDWVKEQAKTKMVFINPFSLTLVVNLANTNFPYPPNTYLWALDASGDAAKSTAKSQVVLAEPGTFVTSDVVAAQAGNALLYGTAAAVAAGGLLIAGFHLLK